jgi:uncharacterized repeat protein (TIGR01451 family)
VGFLAFCRKRRDAWRAGILTLGLVTSAHSAPIITSLSTVSADPGVPFSYRITSNPPATSYGISVVPPGLTFNPATGLLSGTPSADGSASLLLTATDASGTGLGDLELTFTLPSMLTPRITSIVYTNGTVGSPFTYQIYSYNSATGYGASNLPPGLALNPATGQITGTPVAEGITDAIITATNAYGTSTRTLRFTIDPAAGNHFPVAYYIRTPYSGNVPLTVSFSASYSSDDGSIVSYDWWFADGTIASGVTCVHTYTAAGIYSSLLTVTDNGGKKAYAMRQTEVINVLPAQLSAGSGSAAPGSSVDVPVSFTPSPDISAGNFQFDLEIPAGLTFISAQAGPALLATGHSLNSNLLGGSVRIMSFGMDQNVLGAGVVALIRLQVNAGAVPGTLPLNLTNASVYAAVGSVSIPTTVTSGQFTILEAVNQAPVVSACSPSANPCPSQTATLPDPAFLNGTATDDGLPNPPGALTYSWSKLSGPGSVTFGNPSALQTTATFSAAGTYVVLLTAFDGQLSGTSDVTITAVQGTPSLVLTKTSSPLAAKSGDTVTFTIQYQNTGTAGATSSLITDGIPAGTTLVAGSISSGGTLSGSTISWNLGTVAAGASGAVSFQVRVN